jgi:hypothetical protein
MPILLLVVFGLFFLAFLLLTVRQAQKRNRPAGGAGSRPSGTAAVRSRPPRRR